MVTGTGLKEEMIKDGAPKVSQLRRLFEVPIDKLTASEKGHNFCDPAILEVTGRIAITMLAAFKARLAVLMEQ